MVGMSWDNNDERKMASTFGFGRGVFGGFVDAGAVALALGYPNRGLASLADSVLGITLLKSQHVRLPLKQPPIDVCFRLRLSCVVLSIIHMGPFPV
jgi:hypothetical protein